ncbi:MAG: CBM35 domain-containing protein, partial [Syntrophothermus sp.]
MRTNKYISRVINSSAALLITSSLLFSSSPDRTSKPNFYEAEKGKYERLTLLNDTSASGGEYLHMDSAGTVSFKVRTAKAGWHSLIFRYRAPGGEKEEYVIRNGYKKPVGFEMSDKWNLCTTKTFLNKGMNDISLEKSWGNIDLDYLSVEPVSIMPVLSPQNNFFYKEHPYDITVNVKKFGSRLKSVTCEKMKLKYEAKDFADFEDAVNVRIPSSQLMNISEGKQELSFNFTNGTSLKYNLTIEGNREPAKLTIIAPDVEHGNSVLILLPTGKTMLVDCGKSWVRDSILIPFLDRHGINKIDYFIITHYHGDHDSDDRGMKIKQRYNVDNFFDNQSFTTGASYNVEGVNFKILNSYSDGTDENSRSLSCRMEYNGFVYVHGADTYADNQKRILKDFPDDIKADVFFANHHFHGSADTDYLRAVEPKIVLLQAEKAIYARSTYMVNFSERVVPYLKENKKGFIEVLPNLEVGTVVIRVNDKNDWTYESYR